MKISFCGLVTVNWSPQNPWINNESDIINNPGHPSKTRNKDDNMKNVDLNRLVDPADPVNKIWRKKPDRIADALGELKDAGVVVLWRPMQEMNGIWFWWGIASHPHNPEPYIKVYRDMFEYIRKSL